MRSHFGFIAGIRARYTSITVLCASGRIKVGRPIIYLIQMNLSPA